MINCKKKPDKVMSLKDAVSTFVHDGDKISFGGFGTRDPVACVLEVIRQNKKDLTLIGDSPSETCDLLIAAGCLKRAEIAYCSYGLPGLAYNFRRAIEQGIPQPLDLVEYSNAATSMRLLAGALNVPYIPIKSLLGSDLMKYNKEIKEGVDPFTGEKVALVSAAHPNVALIHVHRADKQGNAQIFGQLANDDNLARAAKHVIITCEEIVDSEVIKRTPNLTAIPAYCVDAVVELPFAIHPENMPYKYSYDVPFQMDQMKSVKTREGTLEWLNEWCYSLKDHREYCEKLGWDRLEKLAAIEKKYLPMPY